MTIKERIKRYVLFVLCLFFMGLGVALTKHGNLGVSPISSVANVISMKFPVLSFGTWLMISNIVLLVGQILLLRRRFQWFQLLQIPLSVLFGWFTDFGMWLVGRIPNDVYIVQIALVAAGVLVLGFGIALGVIADVILNSGEAFVKALADVTHKEFGNMKIAFDTAWVAFSIVLSLLLFDGRLVGVREGTVISAVCVGLTVKMYCRWLKAPLTRLLKK